MIIQLLNTAAVSHVKQEKIKKSIYEWLYENSPVMQADTVYTYDHTNNILVCDKIVISSLTLKHIPFNLVSKVLRVNCVQMKNFGNSITCESLHFVNCNSFDFSSVLLERVNVLTLYHCDNATVDGIVSIKNISDGICLTSNSSFVDFSNYKKLGLLPTTHISLDISSKHIIHIKNVMAFFDIHLLYKSLKITNYASMDMHPRYVALFRTIEQYTEIPNRLEHIMDLALYLIDNDFESVL